mmetsp:Transcript_13907/g.40029  ORF Transcript_13907/g.40029 Transcript_13907/m.40029 type:complete len:101 (+) Transcript_13907:531-833(+)
MRWTDPHVDRYVIRYVWWEWTVADLQQCNFPWLRREDGLTRSIGLCVCMGVGVHVWVYVFIVCTQQEQNQQCRSAHGTHCAPPRPRSSGRGPALPGWMDG